MLIDFVIAGEPAQFEWSAMTGRGVIRAGGEELTLDAWWNPRRYYNLGTRRVWRRTLVGHQVTVEKVRARVAGAFRENAFTISVDGERVAEASGR